MDTLDEALELIRAGKRQEASVLLAHFLSQNPHHERAWHMLSYACTERDKQIYALQRVLQSNPDNRVARKQLDRLYSPVMPPTLQAMSQPAPAGEAAVRAPAREGKAWSRIARTLRASPSLLPGILIILVFVGVAIAAPLIAPPAAGSSPYDIPRYGFSRVPKPPTPGHPLGLLAGQYDIFYGLIWGIRAALQVGVLVTLGRVLLGTGIGLISGYVGGLVDATIMRLTDAFMAFPIIAVVMVVLALSEQDTRALPDGRLYMGPSPQEQVIILTLVVFGWMSYARLLRGNVLSEREREYMQAAKAAGVGSRRLISRHLLPNVTQGLLVLAASDIGAVVVLIAAFTFIGLLTAPRGQMQADWGQMLSAARDWIIGTPVDAFEYWYTYIPVSLALVLFSSGWNLLGDGLRDLLDPRLRKASPRLRTGSKP